VPRLFVTKGPDEGKQFELTGDSIPIGRDAGSRIRMNDTEVSRRHAELVRTADGYRILDKGSANGTFVNNQSVKDALLHFGDRVQVGQSVMVFSPGRGETPVAGDLAEHINLIARQDLELSGSIVGTIDDTEGGRLLIRPDQAGGPWPKTALANLGLLYEATRAVSHILDLDELLERLLELIFRALEPDRGCVLLRADDDERGGDPTDGRGFEPKAVRWRDGADRQERIPISRTIVDHVLREKQGILVSDAGSDERFQAVQSVVRLGIREVICVPMKGRHGTLGVLYLDTRTTAEDGRPALPRSLPPPGKFTADDLALAISLAHLGALAVEETRYHQALVQAERLAAVGQTIAGLSHHIKNILQGLRTGGDIVTQGLNERDLDYLARGWRIVEKNQGKIEELVMDMLSFSKEREPAIAEIDLNALVHDVAEVVAGRATEKNVTVRLDLDPSLPKCPADYDGIHRSLLNLVSNALDAVEEVDAPAIVLATGLEPDGGWLRVEVKDNGSGIAADQVDEIFRPFVSSKGARGTGLGLAVSRKTIREHGGDIVVRSQVGRGSLFIVRLPLRASGASSAGTATHQAFSG
jgi:signal transduction histidine kinase/pSer/pThr/pTyr-binding forkhead associated (FHA) protein